MKKSTTIFSGFKNTDGRDPKERLADLKANDVLSSLIAIKEDRIYIDYNQFWSYWYQILNGMEQLSAEMQSKKLIHSRKK